MRTIPNSELIINSDGSIFHLHIKPEQLAETVILVGDPARVNTVAANFDSIECEVSSREFHTITGTYKGKRNEFPAFRTALAPITLISFLQSLMP